MRPIGLSAAIIVLAVFCLFSTRVTAEVQPCEHSTRFPGQRCLACHTGVDGRRSHPPLPGSTWLSSTMQKLENIPPEIRNSRYFKRYLEENWGRPRSTWRIGRAPQRRQESGWSGAPGGSSPGVNGSGDHGPDGGGSAGSLFGIDGAGLSGAAGNAGHGRNIPSGRAPAEPGAHYGYSSLDTSGGLFTDGQTVVADGGGGLSYGFDSMPANGNDYASVSGTGPAELQYTMRDGDDLRTVVRDVVVQVLADRGIRYEPTASELDRLVRAVREYNLARWSFGDAVPGDVVGFPAGLFEAIEADGRRRPSGDSTATARRHDGNFTPQPTATGFDDFIDGLSGVQHTSSRRDGRVDDERRLAGAALDELERMDREIEQIFSDGAARHITVDSGNALDTYRLDDSTRRRLSAAVRRILDNGNTATMLCPIYKDGEISEMRRVLDELVNGSAAIDMHAMGFGQEPESTRREAADDVEKKVKRLRKSIMRLRKRILDWESSR